MDEIFENFKNAKKKYDKNIDSCLEIKQTAIACLRKMRTASFEDWNGPNGKKYLVYGSDGALSRPFLKNQLIATDEEFEEQWEALLQSANSENKCFDLSAEQVSKILYNAVVPFCVCFDIWKTKSRKTPGTFFEIVLGTLISRILPSSVSRTKHIQLPANVINEIEKVLDNGTDMRLVDMPEEELVIEGEKNNALSNTSAKSDSLDENDEEPTGDMQKVSTDIVFDFNGKGIVIPAKITTRERIVQPFAHQRILDGVFGKGRYISLLICVSETQRSDENHRINDICVPGTITLFQKHLANIGGIFYLDPPERYLALGRAGIVPIHPLGMLLTSGLSDIVRQLN